jgi:hypothetical protein
MVAVVQSQIITQAAATWSGTFTNPVTAGNTIILLADAAAASGTVSTSSPLYNGLAVTGATKLWDLVEGTSNLIGSAGWMLPNVSGSSSSVALTYTGGGSFGSGATGLWGIEVSGLGANPIAVLPAASAGTTGTALSSGATSNAPSSGIAVGQAAIFGIVLTSTGGGWTYLPQMSSDFGTAGYQLVSSGNVTFAGTGASAANGATGAAIILASPASPQPLVVPSLAAIQAANW